MSDLYPAHMAAHGSSHHRARLDEDKVRYIRAHTELSNADLARLYGVTRATIRAVRANVAWHDPAYVPVPSRFWGTGVRAGEEASDLLRKRERTLAKVGVVSSEDPR